ncbi:MAG: hypothetical protein ABGY11_16400 [Candidatus Thioglobus sp.]|jgi:hypothetical protein
MKIKQLLISISLLTASTYSNAEIMESWAEWMYDQLNKPIISTLNIYRADGLVLIDVGQNYAAYSSSPKKLTKEQRNNISTVENDVGFVLSFNSCNSKQNNQFLDGSISLVSVKSYITEASELAGEILNLVEFSSSKAAVKFIGKSQEVDNQTFISWKDDNGTTIELQINKEIHQAVWTAYTKDYPCNSKK